MSNHYLLLDGVLYKQAFLRLYGHEDGLEIEPLYAGTPWHEVADLGPILVKPGPRSVLLNETATAVEWQGFAMLSSPAPMADVACHLRLLNKVTDPMGNERLLRYADPLVAWFWLRSYGAAALKRILGPLTEWHLSAPICSWLPQPQARKHGFSSLAEADAGPVQKLGQAQMAGLEKAYRWQLKERLYHWLQQNQPVDLARIAKEHLDAWLDERLTSAEAFGLTSERSIAIWCALSLRHGDDFSAANNSAYRQWSVRQTAAPLYTADQRLQQYYQNQWGQSR